MTQLQDQTSVAIFQLSPKKEQQQQRNPVLVPLPPGTGYDTIATAFGFTPVPSETWALNQKADPIRTLFPRFSDKPNLKAPYVKETSSVTLGFGTVLPAGRWKRSFSERPNKRERLVQYWQSNGASG